MNNHIESGIRMVAGFETSTRREEDFSLRMYEVMPGDIIFRPKSKPKSV